MPVDDRLFLDRLIIEYDELCGAVRDVLSLTFCSREILSLLRSELVNFE